jgi:hypothetical protein
MQNRFYHGIIVYRPGGEFSDPFMMGLTFLRFREFSDVVIAEFLLALFIFIDVDAPE